MRIYGRELRRELWKKETKGEIKETENVCVFWKTENYRPEVSQFN